MKYVLLLLTLFATVMAQTSDPDQIVVVTSAPASAGKSTEDMRALVRASQSAIAERALENYEIPDEFSELYEVVHTVEVVMDDDKYRIEVSECHKGPYTFAATFYLQGEVRDFQGMTRDEAEDSGTALRLAFDLLSSGKLNQ